MPEGIGYGPEAVASEDPRTTDTPPSEVEERSEEVVNSFFDVARDVLSREEKEVLVAAIESEPMLYDLIEKVFEQSGPLSGEEGEVDGPGTGTSDSIPANLSDGEFIFTAKAVKQLGVDKLRKLMEKAEEEYDRAMVVQTQSQTGEPQSEAPAPAFKRGGLMVKPEWL